MSTNRFVWSAGDVVVDEGARKSLIPIRLAFDPSEARDDTGKWTSGSGKPSDPSSYRGGHHAPGYDEEGTNAPLHALDTIVPADIYDTKVQHQYYGGGGHDPDSKQSDIESFKVINAVRGKPDAPVTIYRAIPKDAKDAEIHPGDWVTPSAHYAKWHGESNLGNWDESGEDYIPDYKVISKTVPAKELFWDANSVNEFGWDPSQGVVKNLLKSHVLLPMRLDWDEAQHPRDDFGRFTSGAGTSISSSSASTSTPPSSTPTRITAAEARGNSRPVTAAEYDAIAASGRDKLEAMKSASSPITSLERAFSSLKTTVYSECQKSWGGMTIDSHTGTPLATDADAYAVTVRPPGQSSVSIPEFASPSQFHTAMDIALQSFRPILEHQSHYLGIFHDDDTHSIDIDPVVVVHSQADAEAIGAYTHAVGGAYHFKSGNGFWPPHVVDGDQDSTSATLDKAMGSDVHFKGLGHWWSQSKKAHGLGLTKPAPTSDPTPSAAGFHQPVTAATPPPPPFHKPLDPQAP